MTSKEAILTSIRRNRPTTTGLPGLNSAWTTYGDRRARFIEILKAVGGQAIVAHDTSDLSEQLHQLPQLIAAKQVVSLVSGVGSSNVDLAAVNSPHDLANVDLAVLPGEFAVAENAAVWVTDCKLPYRVLYFLCQHLVLVMPADAIVDHMHAAYARIADGAAAQQQPAAFAEPVFGAFISGPSKTADIEQTLVVGAHGARSLTVCLLEKLSASIAS